MPLKPYPTNSDDLDGRGPKRSASFHTQTHIDRREYTPNVERREQRRSGAAMWRHRDRLAPSRQYEQRVPGEL